jgi:acetolactate decarboxylase
MNRTGYAFTAVGVAALMIFSGLVGYWAAPNDSDDGAYIDGYYQVSTYARLRDGCYGGGVTIERLLENGDFGIGTVEGIDGEMMIVDGIAYRAGTDLAPVKVPAGTMIPFAMLTHFDQGLSYSVKDIDDYNELRGLLGGLSSNGHIGYGVMIETEFTSITIRSVPGQVVPYPPLVDVVANQTTMVLHNVKGTMVGFIMADDLGDINLPGFHLHFLSDDLSYGGHVLDMSFEEATVDVDGMNSITVTFVSTQ